MSSAKFSGRIYLSEEEVFELTIWNADIEPMSFDRRGVADWVAEHISQLELETLRVLLGLPEEGSFQCVFSGSITGYWTMADWCREYDEDIEFFDISFEAIPNNFLRMLESNHVDAQRGRDEEY